MGDLWFFDRIAPVYDRVMPAASTGTLEAALGRADRPVERVLDVGGGTGRASRAVEVPERIVLDASGGMLSRVPAGIGRVLGDARHPPFRAGSIDAVLIVDALHHLPERTRVLDALVDVLRPGGVLVVSEFDPSTLRGRVLEAGEHLLGMTSQFDTPAALVEALSRPGLEPVVVESGFGYTVAATKPGG
jgi:demethylmenaquinone methyltransferase/2-methoxy-6-polyprenyl-1,4-benzoquinol methylase